MINKLIIIINGKGESGKDTLVSYTQNRFNIKNISSIDPIKEIAYCYGWSGRKDNKARLFLSSLKKAFTEFNNLPELYIEKETHNFINSESQILFVHIREPENIETYKKFVETLSIPCITLLVIKKDVCKKVFGNISDDSVDLYKYDYYFTNNYYLDDAKKQFLHFIEKIIEFKNIKLQ